MDAYDIQVAKRAAQEGLLSETELAQSRKIQQICQSHQIQLPLSEIILQKVGPTAEKRQLYLECLVQELELPEIRSFIDPYGMEAGSGWESLLIEASKEEKTPEALQACKEIQNYMQAKGIKISLTHIFLLKYGQKPEIEHTAVNKERKQRSITLATICERQQKGEIIPLESKIAKLCGKIVPMETIEEALKIQKELREKWQLNIPLIHILIEKYNIEACLLHALLLAQLQNEGNSFEICLGGITLRTVEFSDTTREALHQIQNILREFLETSFQMTWLTFPGKEMNLASSLKGAVEPPVVQKALEIHRQLSQEGVSLSFLKILWLTGNITYPVLLGPVLQHIYSVPQDNIQKILQSIRNPQESLSKIEVGQTSKDQQAKGQKPSINPQLGKTMAIPMRNKAKKQLSQTMAVSQRDLEGKEEAPRTAAAARIMSRLKKNAPADAPPDTVEAQVEEPVKTEEKPTAKVELVEVTMSEELARASEALKAGRVSSEHVIDALLIQVEQERGKNLLDIFLQQGFIDEAQHGELQTSPVSTSPVKVTRYPKLSQKLDLALAQTLMEYNMVERARVQSLLRIQNSLNKLDIIRTLGDLLICTRTLAADMVRSLEEQCHKKAKAASKEGVTMNKEFVPIRSAPRPPAPNFLRFVPVIVIVLCLLIAYWNFMGSGPKRLRTDAPSTKEAVAQKKKENQLAIKTAEKAKTEAARKIEEEKRKQMEAAKIRAKLEDQKRIESLREKDPVAYIAEKFPDQAAVTQEWASTIKQETIEIKLTGEGADYLMRGNNYGIVVRGKLALPPLPGDMRLILGIQLFGGVRSRASLQKKFFLSPDNEFRIFLGPFTKPLVKGIYHIRLLLEPSIQNSLVKTLLRLQSNHEWWVPLFVGSPEVIKKAISKEYKKIKGQIKNVDKNYEAFLSMAQKKQKQLEKEWDSWSKQWESEHQHLQKSIQKYKEGYLIPVFPETTEQLERLLHDLKQQHAVVGNWIAGKSLIPPDLYKIMDQLEKNRDRLALELEQEQQRIIRNYKKSVEKK